MTLLTSFLARICAFLLFFYVKFLRCHVYFFFPVFIRILFPLPPPPLFFFLDLETFGSLGLAENHLFCLFCFKAAEEKTRSHEQLEQN